MPRHIALRLIPATMACAVFVTCVSATEPAQVGGLGSLSAGVQSFLSVWLVSGDPRAAVDKHIPSGPFSERLIPSRFFPDSEYRKRVEGNNFSTLPRDEAVTRLAQMLTRWRGAATAKAESLGSALAPIDEGAVPDLWGALNELKVKAQVLPGLAALAYPLSKPADYEWISSTTVGFKDVIPAQMKDLQYQGVVCRVRTPGLSKPWMLFMFWAAPKGSPAGSLTLRGLAPVPTE